MLLSSFPLVRCLRSTGSIRLWIVSESSEREGIPIATRLSARHQRPAVGINDDPLPATDRWRPRIEHLDLMSAPAQIVQHWLGNTPLDDQFPARNRPEARGLDRGLDAVAVVE